MKRQDNSARNSEIVARRRAGEQPSEIVRAMDLSRNVISGVLNRAGLGDTTSRHSIKKPRMRANSPGRLEDEDVRAIRALRDTGMSQTGIGRVFNIHHSHVSRITRGLSRSYVT